MTMKLFLFCLFRCECSMKFFDTTGANILNVFLLTLVRKCLIAFPHDSRHTSSRFRNILPAIFFMKKFCLAAVFALLEHFDFSIDFFAFFFFILVISFAITPKFVDKNDCSVGNYSFVAGWLLLLSWTSLAVCVRGFPGSRVSLAVCVSSHKEKF